jgi:hypothetical protein
LPVAIGRSVRVAEAAGACQAVFTYAPQHPEAQHYLALAQLVAARLALPGKTPSEPPAENKSALTVDEPTTQPLTRN